MGLDFDKKLIIKSAHLDALNKERANKKFEEEK